jgi:hypothetical protein
MAQKNVELVASPAPNIRIYIGYVTGRGRMVETWGGWPDGLVNQRTTVFVNVCKVRAPENVAEVGTGCVHVCQVVPADDNTITVVFSTDATEDFEYRAHIVIYSWT